MKVLSAGPQGQVKGLDLVDFCIPRTLERHGEVEIDLTVGGISANPVTANIAGCAGATLPGFTDCGVRPMRGKRNREESPGQ